MNSLQIKTENPTRTAGLHSDKLGPVAWLGGCLSSDVNRLSGLEGRRSPWVKDKGGRWWTLDGRDCQVFFPLPLANPVPEAHSGWWQETRGIVCEVGHLTVQPKVALNLQSCWLSLLSVEMTRVGFYTLLHGDLSMILLFILTIITYWRSKNQP